jgi:ubiquinone/menaquinone biosynthesis C-methylase UbiE
MEADEYLKLAEVEDRMWYFRSLHRHVERELIRALGRADSAAPSPAPRQILDAGCGTGGLIRRLAPRHSSWQWTGADLMPLACDLARQRLGATADIRNADVTSLPFADARFDAIVSADVLYHVDDDAAALKEFVRVLRPGGAVIVNVPAYRWLWSYHDTAVHSRRRYGRAEVLQKLRVAGFTGVRATFWNALPFPLVVARRKLLPAPADGSDVRLYPAPIEAVFNTAMAVEHAWVRAGGRWAWGSSIFAVANKLDV